MTPGVDYIGIGCGATIIDETGTKTLLVRRYKAAKSGGGQWERPGGKIEYGEKATDAVCRETLEEVGVEIDIVKFLGYTDHRARDFHWISLGFLAKIRKGTPRIMEPDKQDEIGWFNLDDLPENIWLPTMDGIIQYMKEKNEGRI